MKTQWGPGTAPAGPEGPATSSLIGDSAIIRAARRFVVKVAPVDSPVLILGPSGSGKEVLAKDIHSHSGRGGAFIAVNAANLSEHLLESELFGHEKGAFTGAIAARPGKIELASGGTLFLDEIGEMAPSLQAKLLRVLQEGEYFRVGGIRPLRLNARLVAATNRKLREMVSTGNFREDLFYRLYVLSFELTSLAERREDLPPLIDHFWDALCRHHRKPLVLAPDAVERIAAAPYPGNVRELKHRLERLIVLAPDVGLLTAADLPDEQGNEISAGTPGHDRRGCLRNRGLRENLEQFESRLVFSAMEQAGHNQVKAARILRISTGALQYKLKKYGYALPGKKYSLDSELG